MSDIEKEYQISTGLQDYGLGLGVRATQMEGSFGTQKEHYAMRRIKARKKKTEILYIFFGIHTANAVHQAASGRAERDQGGIRDI